MKRSVIIHTILSLLAITLMGAAIANAYMAPTRQERVAQHQELVNSQGLPREAIAIEGYDAEVCFNREQWDARLEDLPCDLLSEPEEDGSGFLMLGTLGADAAECIIPNPYEERGQFVIHCHRVPNR